MKDESIEQQQRRQHSLAKQTAFATAVFWLGLILGIVWLIWYLGGGSGISNSPTAQENQDDLWKIKAQEDVRTALKDGASAEFRNVRIHRREGAPFVCGEVNAKNSFGGRSGYQRFVYAGSLGLVLEEQVQAGEMNKVAKEFCGS